MRKFAECWSDFEFVHQLVAKILWRTNIMLMDKLESKEERIWYEQKTILPSIEEIEGILMSRKEPGMTVVSWLKLNC